MTDTTQAVASEADTQAKPVNEAESARVDGDELDKLLAQYDQETAKPAAPVPPTQPQQTTQIDPALLERLNAVEGLARSAAEAKLKSDMLATVKDIRGDLDSNVFDDGIVEAWLDAQARQDPRLQQAWLNRDANPKAFAKVKAELGRQFNKKFSSLPDRQATEDREAVAAAVRGASTKAPAEQAPNFGSMSDAEFRKVVENLP